MLVVKDLKVTVEEKLILKGLSLVVGEGEMVAVMGPNGSGKSTLAYTLAGHPSYEVKEGEMMLDGERLNKMGSDARAKAGLFLAFQYPVAIAGVGLANFLRLAWEKRTGKKIPPFEFKKIIEREAEKLKIKKELLERSLNDGFSGGEKKKAEILQLAILKPKLAILDETDSGLDVDALKIVAEGVNRVIRESKKPASRRGTTASRGGMGVLVITHYQRILKYLKPDRVVVIKGGRVVKEGGRGLVKELEKTGYEKL